MASPRARNLLLLVLLVTCGCVNPFTEYYRDLLKGQPISADPRLIPHNGEPTLYTTRDMPAAVRDFHEAGYRMVGWCRFNASSGKVGLVEQARKVGAACAIVQTSYSHTVQGAVSIPVPQTTRTTTRHSGTVTSGTQLAFYSSTSTSTSRTMGTKQVPYSIDKYNYVATFWAKMKPTILGVMMAELEESTRRYYERNNV